MEMLAILPFLQGGGILGELLVIGLIALVIFIVMKLGKLIFKVIFGIIINSVLGVMLLFLVDYLFGLGIAFSLPLLVPIALFGLPATGTIVLLKLLGITAI